MLALMMALDTEEDRISFKKLYEKTYRKFMSVALAVVHNQADAEEAVHDVYVKWAVDYEKYRDKSQKDMLRLGFIMTKNRCVDLLRERKRHVMVPIEINADLLGEAEIERGGEGILDGIVKEEDERKLVQIMKGLQEEEQVILMLRYDRELSYELIAEEMKLEVNTVKMRLYRIKKKIREEMLRDE